MLDTYKNELYLSNDSMEFGRCFNINGRSVGNCVRGNSKTCGNFRFKLICKFDRECNVNTITKEFNIDKFILTGVDLDD